MVLRGRKLVKLYGCDIDNMFPNELGSRGRTIQSQINCDSIQLFLDNDVLKKYIDTDCYYSLLKEGDLLYFPAFWWHQIKSPELTISVNVFFGDLGQNNYVSKIIKSPQKNAFLYWIYNIIKQNMSCPSFTRILLHLRDSIKYFLFKQWHEVLDDDQLNFIYDSVVEYFHLKEKILELNKLNALKKSKNPPALKIRGLLMRSI